MFSGYELCERGFIRPRKCTWFFFQFSHMYMLFKYSAKRYLHCYCLYHVSGTVLSAFGTMAHLILTGTFKRYYHCHLMEKKLRLRKVK